MDSLFNFLKAMRIPAIWWGYFYLLYKLSLRIHGEEGILFGAGAIVGGIMLVMASAIIGMIPED